MLGCAFERVISSTTSPFCNWRLRGTIVPLTFAPTTVRPQLGVDSEREVNRGRARGKIDHVASRGEHEHLFAEEVRRDRPQEVAAELRVARPVEELLAEPGKLLDLGVFGRTFLVSPMGRDAVLGDFVHFPRSNLHFERFPVRPHHLGVERLIPVALRLGDVVIKEPCNGQERLVDDSERQIAVAHLLDDDAQGEEVVDFLEASTLLDHFFERCCRDAWAGP